MKLRYLYLPDLPPLSQVRIAFGPGVPLLIDRTCAIRFVVGVNGTGKSRLMQALAEIFLNLEAPRLPGFPFALAYDLSTDIAPRTIFIRHLESSARARLLDFDELVSDTIEWQDLETLDTENEQALVAAGLPRVRVQFSGANLPSMKGYLPNIVLAYTSGDQRSWEKLFRNAAQSDAIEQTPGRERPRGWTRTDEIAENNRSGEAVDDTLWQALSEGIASSLSTLITPAKLKLALCAVALHRAVQDFQHMPDEASEEAFIEQLDQANEQSEKTDDLRRILNQVDWLWPISISLRVDMRPDRLTPPRRLALQWLYQFSLNGIADVERKPENLRRLVTSVVRDPEGSEGRLLVYDLRHPLADYPSSDQTTAYALIEGITKKMDATPFDTFLELSRWYDDGLLEDVSVSVRKRYTDDLLLYDWLSDGERMFLGRMALFHLLKGIGDALVLLDEPETHFNDVWKREIVGLIDEAIGNEPSDVVISTHSSITLSDVANEEIELLYREEGHTVAGSIRSPTFGADPSEIMVHIFGAEDSIGRRSLARLDSLIAREWTVADTEWLERIIRQIGPGYHRSELRTILGRLRAIQS